MTVQNNEHSQANKRLKTLYKISKLLSKFEDIEKSFSEIVYSAVESFPLLTVVLIEHWESNPKIDVWHFSDVSVDQVEKALLHARNTYAYLLDASISKSAAINTNTATLHALVRHDKNLNLQIIIKDNYIVLPLILNNLPPLGALQLEGATSLTEADLEFVNALADLLSVAMDRFYKTKWEHESRKEEAKVESKKLSVSQKEVVDLETERGLREVFVSLLTHDLRSPLTAALMSAQLIKRKKDDPEACYTLAGKIADNINRAGQMISDLLDANLISSGGELPLKIEPFNLVELVKKTIEDMVAIHGDRFNFINQECIDGFWDQKGIRRIIENLCNNAIKYGEHTKKVSVSLLQNKDTVQLEVQNYGELISEVDQKTLFEQFHRSESAQKSNKKGWGLGLTLVRGVVEAHGGSIAVKSDVVNGTVFTVILPMDSRKD
jgi:signal transduction histidine kinase